MGVPGRFLSVAACMGAIIAVSAATTQAGTSSATQRSSALEAAVIREVNVVRASKRLSTIARSAALSRAADSHTVAMFDVGKFDHELPGYPTFVQRMRRSYASPDSSWSCAENLALYGPDQPTARQVVDLWMASPPHRVNMLEKGWRDLGVSVRYAPTPGGSFGGEPTWLVTLDLCRRD